MPYFDNDPFPGTDYSQYLTWNKVVTPDGQVMYEVPNNPGYVFDPILSNATGKKMFRQNPKRQIDEENRRKDFEDEQRKQQEYLNSPLGQLVPVAGSIGGMYLANQIINPSTTNALANAAANGATNAGLGASSGAGASTGTTGASGGMSTGTGVQTPIGSTILPDGSPGVIMPDGSTAPVPTNTGGFFSVPETMPINDGLTLGNALSALAIAKGSYDAYQGFQNGGKGIRGGLTAAGAGIGNMILGPIGGAIGAAGGNILGYGLQDDGTKNDIALAAMTGGWSLIPGVGDGMRGLIHETTRQRAQRHTSELLGQNKDDKVYQDYVTSMREQYNNAPPDPSKPFLNGTYGSWDEYKQAGLQAGDLSGVYGNIATFGSEWANMSQAQREAVTQALIDADLYQSKKGEVEIKDRDKAQEIKNNVLKGFNVGANATAAAQGAMGV